MALPASSKSLNRSSPVQNRELSWWLAFGEIRRLFCHQVSGDDLRIPGLCGSREACTEVAARQNE
jgi:hypothetical protein